MTTPPFLRGSRTRPIRGPRSDYYLDTNAAAATLGVVMDFWGYVVALSWRVYQNVRADPIAPCLGFLFVSAPVWLQSVQDRARKLPVIGPRVADWIARHSLLEVRDQRTVADDNAKKIVALNLQIETLTKPEFRIDIDTAFFGTSPAGGTFSAALVRVSNLGAPSAALANTWGLRVFTKDGPYYGIPVGLKEIDDICAGPGSARRFVPEDGLDYKAARGIQRNGYEKGVLKFRIPNLDSDRLKSDDSISLEMSVEDVRHNRFTGSTSIAILKGKTVAFMPELKHPYPIQAEACGRLPSSSKDKWLFRESSGF